MRPILIYPALAALALAAPEIQAQTATQTVAFSVAAINQISVSNATPSTLAITTATAGSAPTSVSSSGLTWAITTNQAARKVTAQTDLDMPTGLTLSLTMAAPSASGSSAGAKTLSTTPQDMVTAVANVAEAGLSMTYQLSATAAAVQQSGSRTVTLTITG